MARARMVEVQVSVQVKQPAGVTLPASLLHAAVKHWAETGTAPRNMRITAIWWRKGGRDYGPYDPRKHRESVLPILLSGNFRAIRSSGKGR